ncbi:MAG: hypothetical protein ABIJ10_04355 [Candidatus Micrarchaeota archaeon]|nr:hypothetical protein [Candidatus Micrarchaeota archaeon]MBU1886152.1 hypothetical protein [Candidatus Micrarchaeota archaeon]
MNGGIKHFDLRKGTGPRVSDQGGIVLSVRRLSVTSDQLASNVVMVATDKLKRNGFGNSLHEWAANGPQRERFIFQYMLPPEKTSDISSFLDSRQSDQFPASHGPNIDNLIKVMDIFRRMPDPKQADHEILIGQIIDILRPHSWDYLMVDGSQLKRVDPVDARYSRRVSVGPFEKPKSEPVFNPLFVADSNSLPTAEAIAGGKTRLIRNDTFGVFEFNIANHYEFAALAAAVLNSLEIPATVCFLTAGNRNHPTHIPAVMYWDDSTRTYNSFIAVPEHPDVFGFLLPSQLALEGHAHAEQAGMRFKQLAGQMILASNDGSGVNAGMQDGILNQVADDLISCHELWGGPSVGVRSALISGMHALAIAQTWIKVNAIVHSIDGIPMQNAVDPILSQMRVDSESVDIPSSFMDPSLPALLFNNPQGFVAECKKLFPSVSSQLAGIVDGAISFARELVSSAEDLVARRIPNYQKTLK